jgi:hypothetical protein
MRAITPRRRPSGTGRGRRGAAATVVAGLAAVLLGGCYKPAIDEGGFVCAVSGKRCPDGFQCAADNHCYQNPSVIDAGSEPMCASPPVTPTCQDAPKVGQVCNPACQKGCDCGRCNVVGSNAACVPSGTITLGEVCKLGNADNCAPGLICLQEACGNGLGRCYLHCTSNDQCDGTICQIPIEDATGQDTGFRACDVPGRACDPVNNTGCPNPALNCYLTSGNMTLCDCPSNPGQAGGMKGALCTIYSDCAPSWVCATALGETAPHCHLACNALASSCPGSTCVTTGTSPKYGYCGG